MTGSQRVIKYLAIALAIFIIAMIISGILSATRLFGIYFLENDATKDMETYFVNSDIQNLNIKINAADFYIKEGDTFLVESNLKHLKVEEKGDTLIIKETSKLYLYRNYKDAVLTIYIPAKAVFNNTSITTGAGRVNFESLSTETIDFELGAGDVSIASLVARKFAKIEGGAGNITISAGILKNLDMQMGVGQVNITSALIGDCRLDSGIGETNITLIGDKDDYRLELEKGLGNIFVDGKNVSDYRNTGDGKNKVEIYGGIGEINVDFKG